MVVVVPRRKANLFYRYRQNKTYHIMTTSDQQKSNQRTPLKCYGCKKRIRSRFYVDVADTPWHENCLRCDVCEEILFSFGSGKCYCRDGSKLCYIDYIK